VVIFNGYLFSQRQILFHIVFFSCSTNTNLNLYFTYYYSVLVLFITNILLETKPYNNFFFML